MQTQMKLFVSQTITPSSSTSFSEEKGSAAREAKRFFIPGLGN
jgi:hypothetical protein